ncbi:pseudaminic acid cytidylyltransferase [Candidatus Merdisoma sp. JLR.KK011]|jgi:pseudaminic acid cytidylyltransferase|uniref:pseudaminic acid cytidylyltransferase n=1 Tax=Candidatus Merdisoma sp. JLR.KK011 TaxID=3114299 RepID=UPI002FEE9E7A
MKPYAIITARGGSKRVPGKNIRDFCGKPIIAYSIEAALESGLFEEVMVSTDSEEIAAIGQSFGASVPFMRSEKTSNDYADTTDVLNEVIGMYGKCGVTFHEFCCIYPTAPFITPDKLKESYRLLQDEDVFNVIPMVDFSFPPQRGMRLREDGFMEPVDPEGINARSQDLPSVYHDCGQFYWMKTEKYLENDNILNNHTKPYFVSELEVQDIDNESDWKLAEIKYRYMKGVL